MNYYTITALIAFILFGMGLAALILGTINLLENRESKSTLQMFIVCLCVFGWDLGYAWMSLCFEDSFAYVPRAIALLCVSFYMFFTIQYVATVTGYPRKKLNMISGFFLIASLVAWTKIIQKDAVEFTVTPWGYWYYSKMSIARIAQFASVMASLILYYIVIRYGTKRATQKRELYVLKNFKWFGPILFSGYFLDTLVPTLFKIPAIPGSCIGAFFSAMILFRISQNNKVFGLSKANVSEYVFKEVHVPVIITDSNDEIVLFNDITPEYLGCDESTLRRKNIEAFFLIDEGESVKVKGKELECKLDKTIVKDRFDSLLYTIYFVQDITKEQKTLRMLNESRELAEEANKAKSNFLANMSHEIRTPMNAVIGMSEILLQDATITEKTKSQVNEIYVAGQNLLGIINDILDISKIEAGKYELINEEYEFPSLIHDITRIIDVRLQESSANFELVIDETIPKRLIGDVGRIRQILLNMLGNSVKFTKKGKVTLDVTWDKNKNNPRLFFDIKDTGIGIKPEDIDKIFGEFNQVDTRKNRNIQGTGLGLAISKHLAELMKGDITVDSVYGEGSTFHVVIEQNADEYLPIGIEIAEKLIRRQYRNEIINNKSEIIPRPDARVLIVDDTRINLMIAKGLLKKYEMKVDTVISGKQAIEMVQRNDYDVVFMDHMMPEMDGVETTKHIRALGGKYESIVIIALTANALNEAKDMFLKEGLQDFIAKPIEADILDDIINKWIPVK